MPSVPVIFTFISVMIEVATFKIGPVTSFEPGLIMTVISLVPIMSVPRRIGIISISRVRIFKVYADMDLGGSRINGKTSGYDQTKNK